MSEIAESTWHQMWKYSDMEASASRPGIADAPPLSDDMRSRVEKRVMAGSADEIVESIRSIREAVGVPFEVVARSYFPDLPYDRQLEIAERLATDVAPRVGG